MDLFLKVNKFRARVQKVAAFSYKCPPAPFPLPSNGKVTPTIQDKCPPAPFPLPSNGKVTPTIQARSLSVHFPFASSGQGKPSKASPTIKAPALSLVYGSERSQTKDPQDMVKHCQMNNITQLWLSKADPDVLNSLRHTHIKVISSVPNDRLNSFAKDSNEAALWVENFILKYWPNVEFQYVCVGHKDTENVLSTEEAKSLLAAMTNINDAIQKDPKTKGKIKVSTTIGINDLESYDVIQPPSKCIIKSSVKGILQPILDFLITNDAPLFLIPNLSNSQLYKRDGYYYY